MKNRIGLALMAALALWASVAGGQTIGADGVKTTSLGFTRVGGITGADSLGRILKMDSQGRPQVIDADRDRDLVLGQSGIINTSLGSAFRTDSLTFGADSSLAFPVGNARHITLWIDAKTQTAKDVRLAVQFRIHLSSSADSNSVATIMPTQMFGAGAAKPFALADSLGDIAVATTGQARPTEILLVWRAAGGFGGSAAAEWSAPRMKLLTYEVPAGAGTYFSVRIRNLSAGYALSSSTNQTATGPVKFIVHYRASAL